MGILLMIESFFLLISMLISLIYGGSDLFSFFISMLISASVGFLSYILTLKSKKKLARREAYIICFLVWVIFSLFGSLPFYFSGHIPFYTDAFFETMSGFTTTGASILNDIESLPKGLLFWRSLTQWMGGMGIILMSLAILPILGIGGMQLFIAEVPGPTLDKLHPRIKETAKRLWGIYILFTFLEVIFLMFGGMSLFDSVCHSFTTMATGGYSNYNTSLINVSPYIQSVVIIFMFIAGTNFSLSFFALNGKFNKIWKNEEFRYYFAFTLLFTFVISAVLMQNGKQSLGKSFLDSLFQVVSLMTTTGYATADYLSWGHFPIVICFIVMFFGGSAGSTGGGIKIVRILLILKNSALELKRLIHPSAIIPLRLNKKVVRPEIFTNILAFLVLYILIFVMGTLAMSILGSDLDTAMGATIASLGNIGPGIGDVGPMSNFSEISFVGKWILSLLMLMGRLELFTVLVIFSPYFWKK